MESGDISNENIRASSLWLNEEGVNARPAWHARLNGKSCWIGTGTTAWIQADIGYQTYASGVVTQGDGGVGGKNGYPDWVTSIKVSTFSVSSNDKEVFIKDDKGNDIKVMVYIDSLLLFHNETK